MGKMDQLHLRFLKLANNLESTDCLQKRTIDKYKTSSIKDRSRTPKLIKYVCNPRRSMIKLAIKAIVLVSPPRTSGLPHHQIPTHLTMFFGSYWEWVFYLAPQYWSSECKIWDKIPMETVPPSISFPKDFNMWFPGVI